MSATGLCGAKNRQGQPCRRSAGWGTGHLGVGRCKAHGGATPNHELAGAVQLARREAAVMGRPLSISPSDAILECIQIAAGEVSYASERIAELEQHEAVGAVVTTKRRPLKQEGGAESSSDEVEEVSHEAPAPHVWITVRREAMDRLVHYSKVAITCNIAERQVKLAEDQGQLFADVIRGILSDLGLSNHPEAPAVVRRHLTLAASNGARRTA